MAATSSSSSGGAALSDSGITSLSSSEAPRGQSATSRAVDGEGEQQSGGSNSNVNNNNTTTSTGTPARLNRGNSFRIPLPPAGSPAASNNNNAISPGSPGGGGHQLGSSYGSNSTTASRLGSFALGFRRNRGASTNRGELTSPAVNPPSPPATATTGFPSLQASTSLTDFGVAAATSPYFEGGDHQQQQQNPASPSQPSSGRGYFSRRGFGRKNTNTGVGFLNSNNNTGNRTPTSEQPPSIGASLLSQTAIQRSRSSSHPSLPLSLSSSSSQQHLQQPPRTANPTSTTSLSNTNTQSAQDSAVAAVIASAVPLSAGASVALAAAGSSSASSNNSSRRQSGEANRTSTTSSPAMHQRSASQAQPASGPANANATSASTTTTTTTGASTNTTTTTTSSDAQHIRLVPHLESTRSLHFDPVSRDVAPTVPLRIGRFTDRNPNQPISVIDQNRVAFKSKVVSRTHAEIWYDPAPVAAGTGSANGGGWFIRDLKSSSGTFLNHIRLSGAGMESRPFPIRDGDVLQLGVDYQGGTEEIYRCVKMRIELNRGWQRGANSFNTNALRQIRALGNVSDQVPTPTEEKKKTKKKKKDRKNKKDGEDGAMDVVETKKEKPSQKASSGGETDCCICLFSVTVYQALFIAPCSHIFHFKCIRPLLMQHHPGFSCPLCRTFGDLEADVEQDDVPEPIEEESSSGSSESESEEEDEAVSSSAPALPDKDRISPLSETAQAATTFATANAQTSENTAVHNVSNPASGSSDPNLDTLRPGRRSPLIPSVSAFSTSTSTGADAGLAPTSEIAASSPRASLDAPRPGARTPPMRENRRTSMRGTPNGVSLEAQRTPHNHLHHHDASNDHFSPPSAGDFDPDIRRGSIYVHGADGQAMHIPITGRSRPGSLHEFDAHSTTEHNGSSTLNQNNASPSVSAADKNKARSVRSMRMTQSKPSLNSLRNAGSASRRKSYVPGASSDEDEEQPQISQPSDDSSPMDEDEPLTARPMSGDELASGHYPFPTSAIPLLGASANNGSSSSSVDASARPSSGNGMATTAASDATPSSPSQEDEVTDAESARAKGKGKRSTWSSTRASVSQTRPLVTDSTKSPRDDTSASFHAVV